MVYEKAKEILKLGFSDFDRKVNQTDAYLSSYPRLLEATKALLREMGTAAICPIAHLAYGWMPRILTFRSNEKTNALLFEASYTDSLRSAELLVGSLRTLPTNNSMVGVSKVLHFMNPHFYPIWDSVVADTFGVKGKKLQMDTTLYKKYLFFVHEQHHGDAVPFVKKRVADMFKYDISDTRAVELLLFVVSKKI